jgi:hypothetical protein
MSEVKKAYSTKKWHDKVMYQCEICPFSTLDLEEAEDHQAMHRRKSQPRVRQTDTGLVGPSGGKIVREETIPPEEPAKEADDG